MIIFFHKIRIYASKLIVVKLDIVEIVLEYSDLFRRYFFSGMCLLCDSVVRNWRMDFEGRFDYCSVSRNRDQSLSIVNTKCFKLSLIGI